MRAEKQDVGIGGIGWTAKRRFGLMLALVSVAALPLAASAQAATVTVGSPLTGTATPSTVGSPATLLNSSLAKGNVTSPINGVIVRWRVQGASGGPFRLRTMTPAGGTSYTGGGSTGPETPTGTTVQTFTSALPIQAGQAIGLDNANGTDKIGVMAAVGSAYLYWVPPLAQGTTAAGVGPASGAEITFNADVQPLPTVTSVGPSSGSFQGGTGVAISGTDFTDVKSVFFGSVPAQSFGVGSEGQMTAIAPAASGPGPVGVTVTTAAGQSAASPAAQFTYTACVVPKLKRKKLKGARKALQKAGCKLGNVRRKGDAGKKARVKKQSSKPGTVLPPEARVNVTLGG